MSEQASLWSKTELRAVFGEHQSCVDVSGISIDTRTLQVGDLFVALRDIRDGHDFIPAAVDAGAVCVMADTRSDSVIPHIDVSDTFSGLQTLGAAGRARSQAKVVAITGSSGKTTCRFWLESLLNRYGKCHASEGSLNNHWGVPLSLARMARDTEFGVFEVGTNHPGEIAPLSAQVRPDIAVLLNVLPAHIGNFPDMAALQQEKLTIRSGLSASGKFVLQHALHSLTSGQEIISFGFEPEADVSARYVCADRLAIRFPDGQSYECEFPVTGQHRVETLLAVLTVIYELGLDVSLAVSDAINLTSPPGRGQVLVSNGVTIIDDSYNANPASMAFALQDFRRNEIEGRKIALLGEMLELGDEAEWRHRNVASETEGLDEIHTFGDGFKGVIPIAKHHHSVAEFDMTTFSKNLKPGDVILIKGSNRVFWQHQFANRLFKAL